MPEPPSYRHRLFTKAFRETTGFTYRKLLIGFLMGLIGRIALLLFGKIRITWADVWRDVLIFVGSYAVVVLASFIVSLVRAPGLLDKERADEVSVLTQRLRSTQQSRGEAERRKALDAQLADLMREGKAAEEAIVTTQNLHIVNNELVRNCREWKERVVSALCNAGWQTDAVAFSHASENPSDGVLGSYEHIPSTKRLYVVQLRMERDKLGEIVERRLSQHVQAVGNSLNSQT
jgi:NhaP-type Na+/H+ or K+/H+ antiporter